MIWSFHGNWMQQSLLTQLTILTCLTPWEDSNAPKF
jgi:hypothetical protein